MAQSKEFIPGTTSSILVGASAEPLCFDNWREAMSVKHGHEFKDEITLVHVNQDSSKVEPGKYRLSSVTLEAQVTVKDWIDSTQPGLDVTITPLPPPSKPLPSVPVTTSNDGYNLPLNAGNNDFQAKGDRNDVGNARRIKTLYGSTVRYYTKRKTWLKWDGMRWADDDNTYIMQCAKSSAMRLRNIAKDRNEADEKEAKELFKWTQACLSSKSLNAAVNMLKSEPGIPVSTEDLDNDPYKLNTLSGVLDLQNGRLYKHSPLNSIITKVCAAEYVPGAKSQLWEKTLNNLFGADHELRNYVQRAMGYSIFGEATEKAFFFCYGPTDGGKSTFLEVVNEVLGDYALCAASNTWMKQTSNGGNRGDLVRLCGRRLVTSSEVSQTAKFDEQIMKAITGGGDTITAAKKFEDEIEFTPTCALWLAGNDRPKIPDGDDAFWRRVRCVPFTRKIPVSEQDTKIKSKLLTKENSSAILEWLVEGYRMYKEHGLGTCAAVQTANQEYRKDNNAAIDFFQECIIVEQGHHESARSMNKAYQEWCKRNSIMHPMKTKGLTLRLRELGLKGNDDESRKKYTYGTDRTWWNVRLTDYLPNIERTYIPPTDDEGKEAF